MEHCDASTQNQSVFQPGRTHSVGGPFRNTLCCFAGQDVIELEIDGDRATMVDRSRVSAAVFGGRRSAWRLQLDISLCHESRGHGDSPASMHRPVDLGNTTPLHDEQRFCRESIPGPPTAFGYLAAKLSAGFPKKRSVISFSDRALLSSPIRTTSYGVGANSGDFAAIKKSPKA